MLANGAIVEPERRTPVYRQCDVLVVGGGPAGTAAATAAARIGADTLLIERYGYLGGMATGGFVLWIDRMTDWQGRRVIAGFAQEILARMPASTIDGPAPNTWGSREKGLIEYWEERYGAFHGIVTWAPKVDPEYLKIASFDLVRESGARLLLHSWAVAPIQQGNLVRGAIFESKSGRQAILAKVVVDATGDGDLFAMAGAEYETGITEANIHHTMNVGFRFGGVDYARFLAFRQAHSREYETLMEAELAGQRVERPHASPRNDVVFFMGPRLSGYSCLSVEDLTEVEQESRRVMLQTLAFYQNHMPGFENAWILDTAPQIGVRHSRRLVGVKQVTFSQLQSGMVHPDEIGLCPSRRPELPTISIPLGCLIPASLDGVLAAGRNLSCDVQSHNILREIPVCWVMGQAAGLAAALAAGSGVGVRNLAVTEIRKNLLRQGACLSEQFTISTESTPPRGAS